MSITTPTIASLQCEVGEWHVATFGEGRFAEKIARKIGEEVIELNQAVGALSEYNAQDEFYDEVRDQQVVPELADIAIALLSLCHRGGVDLGAAISKKLDINRERAANGRWNLEVVR